MSDLVFTPPPGLKWEVTRTPIWSTGVVQAASGREYRVANYSYPRYEIKLSFDVLRMTGSYTEMADLAGFFNARRGSYDTFRWTDPDDNSVTDQVIGTGDASTKEFQLVRTFGGYVEPVHDTNSTPVIKVANSTKTAGVDYNISTAALVTFANAPASNASVTWTGTYYRRCRFKQDSAEFTQFMRLLWSLGELTMVSVKP
jgi:uncharacterized protein (TIGR02217 family)